MTACGMASLAKTLSTGLGGEVLAETGDMALLLYASGNLTPDATATIRTRKAELTQTAPVGFLSWMGETLIVPNMGTLASGAASVAGAGAATWVGSGTLAAQNAGLVSNNALSGSVGTGASVVTEITISGNPGNLDLGGPGFQQVGQNFIAVGPSISKV